MRSNDQRIEQLGAMLDATPAVTKITGSRDLSEAEIALIDRVKAKAEEVGELIAEIEKRGIAWIGPGGPLQNVAIEPRWLAIGRTHLQQGFMAITRAITRPKGF